MGVGVSKKLPSGDSDNKVAPFDFDALSQHYVIDETANSQFETLQVRSKKQIQGTIVGVVRCFRQGFPAIVVINRVVWFAVRLFSFREDKSLAMERLGGFNTFKQAYVFTVTFALQTLHESHSSLHVTEACLTEEMRFLFQHVLVTKLEQLLSQQVLSLSHVQTTLNNPDQVDHLLVSLVSLVCLDDILNRKATDGCFGLIPLSPILYTSAGAPQSMRTAVCYLVSLRCFLGDAGGLEKKLALARAMLNREEEKIQDGLLKPALNILASLSEEVANWPQYREFRDVGLASLRDSLVLQGKLSIPSASALRVMCLQNDGRFRITSGTCVLIDQNIFDPAFVVAVKKKLQALGLPFGPYFLDSSGQSITSLEELKDINQNGNCLVYLSAQEQLVLKGEPNPSSLDSLSSSSPPLFSSSTASTSVFSILPSFASRRKNSNSMSDRKEHHDDNRTSSSFFKSKKKSPKPTISKQTRLDTVLSSGSSKDESKNSEEVRIKISPKSTFMPVPGPPVKLYPGHVSYTDPDIHSGMARAVQEYGTLVELNILGVKTYVVREPAYILAMLDSAPNKHLPDVDLAGGKNGLFFSDGEHWNFIRSTMNPCFYPVRVEKMLSAFTVKANIMLDCIENELKTNQAFDLWKWSERLFYDIMCDVGLDHKSEFFLEKGTQPKIIKLFNTIYEAEKIRQFRPKFLNRLYTPFNLRFQADVEALATECDHIIDARLRKVLAAAEGKVEDLENDILISLINAKCPGSEKKMNREMLRAQILNLLRAGTDTTASCLCWVVYLLSQNVEEENIVLDEMKSVFGPFRRDVNPTASQLKQLKYLDLVIKEAMRLHPPAVIVFRTLDDDLELGPYKLAQGSRMMIDICGLHKDPRFWGSDVNEFRPKRFLDMSAIKMGQYVPFGGGNRTCIGNTMGLLEVKAALVAIYMRCSVLSNGDPVILSPEPNRPLNMMMVLQPHPCSASSQTDTIPAGSPQFQMERSVSTLYTLEESQRANITPPITIANQGRVTVLYGSNQGTCKLYAEQFALRMQQVISMQNIMIRPCDASENFVDLLNSELDEEGSHSVIIVCSTYNGQPPDNARKFVDWLKKLSDEDHKMPFGHLRYLVVGVGNTLWAPTWQRIPSLIDKQMDSLGASRLMPMGCVNMDGDPERDFQTCCGLGLRELKRELGVTSPIKDSLILGVHTNNPVSESEAGTSESGAPPLEYCQVPPKVAMPIAGPPLSGDASFKVLNRRELHSTASERACTHLELALPSHIRYQTGDHLMIHPENQTSLVEQLAARCGLSLDEVCYLRRATADAVCHSVFYGVSLRWALTFHCHITTPPSRQCLTTLAALVTVQQERDVLMELSSNLTSYTRDVLRPALTFCEVLNCFCVSLSALPIDRLLALLPPLLPRFYSISSSSLSRPSAVCCTIAKVDYCPSPNLPPRLGVVSAFVNKIAEGVSLRCSVVSSVFRLPDSPLKPIICVGAGTGLAPFMGFFEERAHLLSQGAKLGEAWLFFGCRERTKDFIYQSELEKWVQDGVISKFAVAFSREQQANYVQDKLREHGAEVAKLLQHDHGVFYVCGDARNMARQVDEALRGIISEHGGLPNFMAVEQFMSNLTRDGQYHRDVWG